MWWRKKKSTIDTNLPIRWGNNVKIKSGFYAGVVARVVACRKFKDSSTGEAARVYIEWWVDGKFGCASFNVEELELTDEPLRE